MITIDEIRAEIARRQFDWKPDEALLKRFASGRPTRRMGLRSAPVNKDILEAANAAGAGLATMQLPPAIDWRNHGGNNWVTPVKYQGDCGSCVAFALIAAAESGFLIQADEASHPETFSEGHLFHCADDANCEDGWEFLSALGRATAVGFARAADFPYQDVDTPCQDAAVICRLENYQQRLTEFERKSALISGPVLAGMDVYEDFYAYRAGIYRQATGAFEGTHAVCVIGYNDAGGYWIAKNSWNGDWGEDGFFRIAYGECRIDSSFPFYSIELE